MFTIDYLRGAVGEHAALRRRLRLQPVGGKGDKVFPPTYPDGSRDNRARHVFEKRRLDGQDVYTVLIDSPQSSSNRSEEALLAEMRRGTIEVPHLAVDFTATIAPEIGEITSLDAPHRVFDAILRDSQLGGVPLMKSELGRQLQTATMADATAIFQTSPTALLFGAWNSTGEGGGLGAKFPRCYVSEIIGVNVPVEVTKEGEPENAGRRTGSRIDPLGTLKAVPIFKGPTDWDIQERKGFKKSKPSEINHGNIAPTVASLGVTMDYAEHTVVITFAGLRRLRFGSAERDAAARTALAALGLVAHLAQARQGYALRSRCDLVPEAPAPFELVRFDGSVEALELTLADAIGLYRDAVKEARAVGFAYDGKPTSLIPQEKLVYLVSKSRELALEGKGGEGEVLDAGA